MVKVFIHAALAGFVPVSWRWKVPYGTVNPRSIHYS